MTTKVWDTKTEKYLAQFRRKMGHPSRGYVYPVLLDKDKAYSNILECGIGVGDIPAFLSKNGAQMQYTGLDCTEPFIEHARDKYPGGMFKFIVGDMNEMPFEDKSFDLVYTRHTLEHLKHYKTATRELFRVARKRVIIILFHNFSKKDKIKLEKKKGVYLNYYSKRPFIELVAGLCSEVKLFRTIATSKFGMNVIVDCTL